MQLLRKLEKVMPRGFVVGNNDPIYLLPLSVDDWLKKDHFARFICDNLDIIDLKPIYDPYATGGKPPFDLRHMLNIFIYAYSKGLRSSRLIAKACEEDIAFRWIAGNILLKHTAICRFRRKHIGTFNHVFLEVLRLCSEAKAINIEKFFLDGTKIKDLAALETNRTLEKIKDEIDKILD